MRITGIALMWIGIVALLKNMGFIEVVNWAIIWPVALIIVGSMLKRGCRGKCWGKGCGMCGEGKNDGHVCEGPNCKH